MLALSLCSFTVLSVLDLGVGRVLVDSGTRSPVEHNAHLWHVFLPSVHCSGSLVDARWVITSALCILQWKSFVSSAVGGFPASGAAHGDESTMYVRVGNNHIDLALPGQDLVPVLKALLYPGFDNATLDGNIGALYLAREPILTAAKKSHGLSIKLLSFDSTSFTNCSRLAKVTGWGYGSGLASPFRVLHEDIMLIASSTCIENQSGNVLLRSNGSRRICSADNGSPLVVNKNGSWSLLGVYSRGKGCGIEQEDSVFSRVDVTVLKWLESLFKIKGTPTT